MHVYICIQYEWNESEMSLVGILVGVMDRPDNE